MERSRKRSAKGVRFVSDITPFFELEMIKEAIAWESALNRKFDMSIKIMCGITQNNTNKLAPSAKLTLRRNHNNVVEAK